MKALYKHKKSGDIFAIETGEAGEVISTAGPLLIKDLDHERLDETVILMMKSRFFQAVQQPNIRQQSSHSPNVQKTKNGLLQY